MAIETPGDAPIATPIDLPVAVDGDAGSYLEELIEQAVPLDAPTTELETLVPVELVGPHLRLAGTIPLGRFRRLSDVLNHHQGQLLLREATVLRRNGTATRVTTPSIWVNPEEVTLVGQPGAFEAGDAPQDMRIPKERHLLIVVTPGHTLSGEVFIPVGGAMTTFIESVDPTFIPMTDVRTRSLADRRISTHYAFALINRRHIVAATEALPGMLSDRRAL